MNPITRVLCTASFAAFVGLPAAFAADAPAAAASGAMVEACKADVQTLCPGIQPGEGRLAACMKENRSKLSSGCKSALRAQRGSRKGDKAGGEK